MELRVNDVKVLVKRILLENGGHILQLRVDHSSEKCGRDVFEKILACLQTARNEVMCRRTLDSEGFAEIRILMGFELVTTLTLIQSGMTVDQVA